MSAAIIRDGRVLIVRRARPPAHGVYTLPGGVVELGETLEEAIVREVQEETALEIEPVGLAGYRQAIARDASGKIERHFVILPFAARWLAGEPSLNEELAEWHWRHPSELSEPEHDRRPERRAAGGIASAAIVASAYAALIDSATLNFRRKPIPGAQACGRPDDAIYPIGRLDAAALRQCHPQYALTHAPAQPKPGCALAAAPARRSRQRGGAQMASAPYDNDMKRLAEVLGACTICAASAGPTRARSGATRPRP